MIKQDYHIDICNVAYIRVSTDIYSFLMDNCNHFADGEDNIIITYQTFRADVKDIKDIGKKRYLKRILKELGEKAGDVAIIDLLIYT